jgi:hydrogenase maturation protease
MGDDGFGLAVLERIQACWQLPTEIELVDGGTWGMKLLPLIESARRVLLLDAINAGIEPGSAVVLSRGELPCYFSHKLSPHQIDLREVLALTELRGTMPDELVAMGVQPESIELRSGLSATLADRVDDIAKQAVARLLAWGHRCCPVCSRGTNGGPESALPAMRS